MDGEAVHSVGLLDHLATLTRNTLVFTGGVSSEQLSVPTDLQRRAFEQIGQAIPPSASGQSSLKPTPVDRRTPTQRRGYVVLDSISSACYLVFASLLPGGRRIGKCAVRVVHSASIRSPY